MNKLIVVTGGSKGIGRFIIEKFMANGFDAVTCARKKDELITLEKALNSRFPDRKFYYQLADVSIPDEVKKFAGFVHSLNRSIDVLVNNAGYFVPGSIAEEPEGTLANMMNANLFSAYHVTRAILPAMKKTAADIFLTCVPLPASRPMPTVVRMPSPNLPSSVCQNACAKN